jgi:uncharacterized protein
MSFRCYDARSFPNRHPWKIFRLRSLRLCVFITDMDNIIWRDLYFKGHEYARLDQNRLEGTAVFVHQETNYKLAYTIDCDAEWNTTAAVVSGFVGSKEMRLVISRSADAKWTLNGIEQPQVIGCTDIDLNFSPSTNLLPIRRLNLQVNEEASVSAAWLRFPSFELEPLTQTYRRTAADSYRYESAGGSFAADLTVNDQGFVVNYPDLWEQERS